MSVCGNSSNKRLRTAVTAAAAAAFPFQSRKLRLSVDVGEDTQRNPCKSDPTTTKCASATTAWQSLAMSKHELRLMVTLMSGQSFRWQRIQKVCDALAAVGMEMPDGLSGDGVFSLVDYCTDDDAEIYQAYMGVLGHDVVVLREEKDDVLFCAFDQGGAVLGQGPQAECKRMLRMYLQAEVTRSNLDSEWLSLHSPVDTCYERRLPFFPGPWVVLKPRAAATRLFWPPS